MSEHKYIDSVGNEYRIKDKCVGVDTFQCRDRPDVTYVVRDRRADQPVDKEDKQ